MLQQYKFLLLLGLITVIPVIVTISIKFLSLKKNQDKKSVGAGNILSNRQNVLQFAVSGAFLISGLKDEMILSNILYALGLIYFSIIYFETLYRIGNDRPDI